MQITVFLRQIPGQMYDSLLFCAAKGSETKEKISQFGQQKISSFYKTELWEHNLAPLITPLHDRTIGRFEKLDYAVLGGTIITALTVSTFALWQLGVAALPLAAGGTVLLMMAPYYFIRHRIHKHFNREASEKLQKIIQLLLDANAENLQEKFSTIAKIKNQLKKTEFAHLENFLKEFDGELAEFQKATLSSGRPITGESLGNATHAFHQHVIQINERILQA